jgi:hypothetical protein
MKLFNLWFNAVNEILTHFFGIIGCLCIIFIFIAGDILMTCWIRKIISSKFLRNFLYIIWNSFFISILIYMVYLFIIAFFN